MDGKDILKAMQDIDDSFIEEAAEGCGRVQTPSQDGRPKKKKAFKAAWVGVAAAACLAAVVSLNVIRDPGARNSAEAGKASYTAEAEAAEDIEGTANSTEKGEIADMINPFETYNTLEEACRAAGFEMEAPEELCGARSGSFRTIPGELIEIIYMNAEGEEAFRIRKGAAGEDISGDYNVYQEETEKEIAGSKVLLKGNGGTVSVAIWETGDYSYSLNAPEGYLQAEEAETIIENVR